MSKVTKIVVICMLLFSFLAFSSEKKVYAKDELTAYTSKQPVGTWIWDAYTLQRDYAGTLKMIMDRNINQVYIHYNAELPNSLYRKFASDLYNAGKRAQFLIGDSSWIHDRTKFDKEFSRIQDFNKEGKVAAERIRTMHVIVQPYHESWFNGNDATMMKKWKDLVLYINAQAAAKNYSLVYDTTDWMEHVSDFEGGNMYQWLLRNTKSLVLMTHHDTKDNVLNAIKNEMTYSKSIGKFPRVAFETEQLPSTPQYTLYEEGILNTYKIIRDVRTELYTQYGVRPAVSIHHFGSYSELVKKYEASLVPPPPPPPPTSKDLTSYTSKQPSGMWVWNAWDLVNKPDQMIQDLKTYNIDNVYVYLEPTVTNAQFRSFAQKVREAGKEMEFLLNDAAYLDNLSLFDQAFARMEQYNAESTAESQKIKRIHMDIEPYILPNFNVNDAVTVQKWKNMVLHVNKKAHEKGYFVTHDTGDWMEWIPDLEGGNMYQWLLHNTDKLILMSYHDNTADTMTAIKVELDYSKKVGIYPELSYETQNLYGDAQWTFYEEGIIAMYKSMEEVQNQVQVNYGYKPRFSIHYYPSYLELVERYKVTGK